MEHRSHKRVSLCRNIAIEYPGGNTVAGTIRDVSFGGIFVELSTTDLPPHGLVQLRIPASNRALETCVRVPAAIARRTQQGLGLLYCGNFRHIRDHIRAWSETCELQRKRHPVPHRQVRMSPLPETGAA